MLRTPSNVEKKAKGVGTQVWKRVEKFVRRMLVGVQWSGILDDNIAKKAGVRLLAVGLSWPLHTHPHLLSAAMYILVDARYGVLYDRALGIAVKVG